MRRLARKKRTYFIPLLIFTVALLLWHTSIRVYPNTTLAGKPVSGTLISDIDATLADTANRPIPIRVKNRLYHLSLADMGIRIDTAETISDIRQPNTSWFPNNLVLFFRSLAWHREIWPSLSPTADYYEWNRNAVFDFSIRPGEVILNDSDKTLSLKNTGERYMIDPDSLLTMLSRQRPADTPVEPLLIPQSSPEEEIIVSINDKLKRIYREPLTLTLLVDKKQYPLRISPDELKSLLQISYNKSTDGPKINVDGALLPSIFAKKIPLKLIPEGKSLSMFRARGEILGAMTARYNGRILGSVAMPIDDGPNTTGADYPKYIEIDISRQTMYLFEHGEAVRRYKVSTGLYYPTPVGKFSILNKSEIAFSDIYNVWMPYWMAFGFSAENNAYFGIHELPYAINTNGRETGRSPSQIGSPSTGGCIALDIGEAKEVYEWADVGTPVVIYP